MSETNQDHESDPQARPWVRRPVIGCCCVLGIVSASVITTVLPEAASPISVVLGGLGLLAAVGKR